MSPFSDPTPHELWVVIAGRRRVGSGIAELWCGSALLGILHEEDGEIVLRLESHANGPLAVNAIELERALAEARESLTVVAGSAALQGCAPAPRRRS